MLLKEKGYDEFLAEKIAKGLKDFEQGRYFTAEQSKAQVEDLLVRKQQELQELESDVIYG